MLEMIRYQKQTNRRAMRSTTVQACGLYPAVGAPSSDPRGVIIGRERYSGRAFIYDPFVLYDPSARERLPSGHALVLGKSGFGKSALEKCYVLRQLRFKDRSFCILDAQGEDGVGEWDGIARQLGITPIRLVYGAGLRDEETVRINPLDSRIPAEHQFKVLSSMVEIIAGALAAETRKALAVAHERACDEAVRLSRSPILSDVLYALTRPEAAPLGKRTVTADELSQWGEPAALALDELCAPGRELAGLFDGQTSDGIDLDARLIVFDLAQLPREGVAMPLLMSVIGPWLRFGWIRSDSVRRTLIVEEAWHILSHRPVARLFQELLKYGRRLGLSFWAVAHHLTDLEIAEAPEAEAILKMTATRVIYHLDKADADAVADYLKLPGWARDALSDGANICRPGNAVWQVGSRVNLVQHIRSAVETRLTDTNRRMETKSADVTAASPASVLVPLSKEGSR